MFLAWNVRYMPCEGRVQSNSGIWFGWWIPTNSSVFVCFGSINFTGKSNDRRIPVYFYFQILPILLIPCLLCVWYLLNHIFISWNYIIASNRSSAEAKEFHCDLRHLFKLKYKQKKIIDKREISHNHHLTLDSINESHFIQNRAIISILRNVKMNRGKLQVRVIIYNKFYFSKSLHRKTFNENGRKLNKIRI